jgi:hypothetical protein
MHANMTDEHKAAFKRLMLLTPTNIHLLSDVTYSDRLDFEALWSKHGPTAARYFLFPSLWYGKLHIYDEHEERRSDTRDSADQVQAAYFT